MSLTKTSDLEPAAPLMEQTSLPDAAPQAKTAIPGYIPSIDGVRALLALYIVLHHSINCVDWPNVYQGPGAHFINLFVYFGHQVVGAFIVVSGYCLMLPAIRSFDRTGNPQPKGALAFYQGRCRRILPTYYASLLINLVLIYFLFPKPPGTNFDVAVPVTTQGLIALFCLFPNLSPVGGQISGVAWSLGVELQIYLWFPLLLKCWYKFGALKTLGGFLTVVLIAAPAFIKYRHLKGVNFEFYALFVIGMAAAYVCHAPSPWLERVRSKTPWALFLVAWLALAKDLFVPLKDIWYYTDLLVGPAMFFFILLAHTSRNVRAVLETPLLVEIGTFSYSLYMVHYIWISIIYCYFVRRLPIHPGPLANLEKIGVMIALGVPVIVGIAWLFSRAFEKPFMNNKTRQQRSA